MSVPVLVVRGPYLTELEHLTKHWTVLSHIEHLHLLQHLLLRKPPSPHLPSPTPMSMSSLSHGTLWILRMFVG